MEVVKRDGTRETLDISKIQKCVQWACEGLDGVSASEVEIRSQIMFFDGITTDQIQTALIVAAGELISVETQNYTYVAARLLLQRCQKEVTGGLVDYTPFEQYVENAVGAGRLDSRLLTAGFDFDKLDAAIDPSRDMLFDYLGLQTLADRYFIRENPTRKQKVGQLLEMPQHFWMRVAIGLAMREHRDERTRWAIEFYNVLSKFEFVSSTPTLFNSGTIHSQMASCYLNYTPDSITGIFDLISECAHLSKYAGGIGTSWTAVRGAGSLIRGTGGKSSGYVPYLKIYNDTAVAVNQGGKRNGAFAPYSENWHADAARFMDLKKQVGDDRLRAREIFPAWWIPDLFMKRVLSGGVWSFFDPGKYAHLHELWGEEFEEEYERLEELGAYTEQVPAVEFWRKMLASLFETGAPWITFKDECNRRNPQQHVGVIHNSNLCTEITLNTSAEETAVCNIGSVNIARTPPERFSEVVPIAMRMLDNVIDLNYYPSEKAKRSNLRHRPVGLGLMGWAEYLMQKGVAFDSVENLQLSDEVFEALSYRAIDASIELAAERGTYETYKGSLWDQGILPIDTARKLDPEWLHKGVGKDWGRLRAKLSKFGMRNSNTMAIAPTATIANIAGTTECIQLPFKRFYTKENLSGTFLVVDPTLKYNRPDISRVAFEIDQSWPIRAAAVRQRWIDQSQSLNLYAKVGTLGRHLDAWYKEAWELGVKTTYYLKSNAKEVAKSQSMEKVDAIEPIPAIMTAAGIACSIDNPEACESCQ